MPIEFVELQEPHTSNAREVFNHYIETSTATFYMKELSADEFYEIVKPSGEHFRTFAILYQGEFTGFVRLSQYNSRCAYSGTGEITIYLKADCTGRKIGPTALEFIENYARTHEFRILIAGICAENEASISFFTNHGYEQCARFKKVGVKFGRTLDVCYYQKFLDEAG